jgi:hypothetical protein
MVSLGEEDAIESGLFGNDPFGKHLIAELRGGFSGRFWLIIWSTVRIDDTTDSHDSSFPLNPLL